MAETVRKENSMVMRCPSASRTSTVGRRNAAGRGVAHENGGVAQVTHARLTGYLIAE